MDSGASRILGIKPGSGTLPEGHLADGRHPFAVELDPEAQVFLWAPFGAPLHCHLIAGDAVTVPPMEGPPWSTVGKKVWAEGLRDGFGKTPRRLLVAMFSTNIHRPQTVVDEAYAARLGGEPTLEELGPSTPRATPTGRACWRGSVRCAPDHMVPLILDSPATGSFTTETRRTRRRRRESK